MEFSINKKNKTNKKLSLSKEREAIFNLKLMDKTSEKLLKKNFWKWKADMLNICFPKS